MTKFNQKLDFPDQLSDINDALADASSGFDGFAYDDYAAETDHPAEPASVSTEQAVQSKPTLDDTRRLVMGMDDEFDDEPSDDDKAYDAMVGSMGDAEPETRAASSINEDAVLGKPEAVSVAGSSRSDDKQSNKKPKKSKTQALYSREALAGLVPTTVFNTATASSERYVPMLPLAKEVHAKRQLILDTETTGLEALNGDRIIEIGIVEVVNRRFTGEKLHVYINPERDMDAEAVAVHGISMDFLADKPVFADIGSQVMDFLDGGEIIAHNAPFDMGFLDMEFKKIGINDFTTRVTVTDSLAVAKSHYPGQKNSLDSLVKRLEIVTKDRTFHGALLDAEILADVYLAMTGGQVSLSLGETSASRGEHEQFAHFANVFFNHMASGNDKKAHEAWLASMENASETFAARWASL